MVRPIPTAWHRMVARSTRPKDARAGRMLAVEVGPELLQALRDEASHRGQPLAALVRRLLTDGLEQAREGGPAAPGRVTALEAALQALAGRVEALERTPRATIPSPLPAAPQPALRPEPAAAASPADAPAGALTTAELAERTGTNRAAWNTWAAGHAIGDVRHHDAAGSWRLAGRAPAPGGGPPRWLWEPA